MLLSQSSSHFFFFLIQVQDCKKFQGELFGICNLFRDLSDKLFTSEIIEMHEEQGRNTGTDNAPVSLKIDVKSNTNEANKVSNLLKSYGEATGAENEATLDDFGKIPLKHVRLRREFL